MLDDPLDRQRALRLRRAREKRYATATDGWKHIKRFTDVGKDAYIQHENGHRGFKGRASEYAKAYAVNLNWLMTGDGDMDADGEAPVNAIPVAGYVAANGEDHFVSDFPEGQGHDYIDPVLEDVDAAYVISGLSMLPRYRPGERVLVGHQTRDPSPWINKDVVAFIKGKGQTTLKTLKMGRDGLWTLRSINPAFDPIEDVELEWVAPVQWVKV